MTQSISKPALIGAEEQLDPARCIAKEAKALSFRATGDIPQKESDQLIQQSNALLLDGLERYPDNSFLITRLAANYRQTGDFPAAITLLCGQIDNQKADGSIYYAIGQTYFDQKRYDLAIESLLTASLMPDSDHSNVHGKLGDAYLKLKKFDDARYHAEKALVYCPNNRLAISTLKYIGNTVGYDAQYDAAKAHFMAGDTDGAQKACISALQKGYTPKLAILYIASTYHRPSTPATKLMLQMIRSMAGASFLSLKGHAALLVNEAQEARKAGLKGVLPAPDTVTHHRPIR